MKYNAIIETDDFKDFKFFEDGYGKYIHGIDAGAVNNEWIALYFTECEQEPKTGHWIITNDYYTGAYGDIDYVECSCCHEYSLEEGDYCPNCGARMVEPQERSE